MPACAGQRLDDRKEGGDGRVLGAGDREVALPDLGALVVANLAELIGIDGALGELVPADLDTSRSGTR